MGMDLELSRKGVEGLVPTKLLQQTSFWGRLKNRLGWESRAFDISTGNVAGDLLVILRDIGVDRSIAYVPYGPELSLRDEAEGAFLEELSERLRHTLPASCMFVRWDLPWESPYALDETRYDESGLWLGRPGERSRELRMNFGTLRRSLRKATSDTLPTDTRIVSLVGTEAELLARMKPKTRYNIRLAARRGIRVREGGPEDLDTWYGLYRETATRNGTTLHGREHFSALFSVRPLEVEGAGRVRLFFAEAPIGPSGEAVPLAALFVAFSGSRAVYLYGASSSRRRDLMAPYALQWAAMGAARTAGCIDYDLFGCSPGPEPSHPMYGLYRFKVGFGGRSLHRQGCWDYPFDPTLYEQYRAREAADRGYYGP